MLNNIIFSHDQLKLLRSAFGSFDSMLDLTVHSFGVEANKVNSSQYHLLHGQLEWRWLYLTLLYKTECSKGLVNAEDSEFRCELILLIYDLLTLSVAKFNKCNSANIIFNSLLICPCVKEMWNLVQHIYERIGDNDLKFWSIVSNLLTGLKLNKNPYENFPTKKILLRNSRELTCKSVDHFSIQLIFNLVKIRNDNLVNTSYLRDSYEIAERLIKSYLNTEPSEENLRLLLLNLSNVIFEVWPPRSEILMTLWEYFQRKINTPFFIIGQNPQFMPVSSSSGSSYLEKIKSQQSTATRLNPNSTSYDMFIYLLGKLVMKYTEESQKIQVQKILSRIYTKFPATKLQTLSELGLHNIIKLFITLLISTNFQDIVKKISETLLSVSLDKITHQQQLLKGHMAILILHCENHLSYEVYLTKLMTQVNNLTEKCEHSNKTSVLKTLAEALPVVMLKSCEDGTFQDGEHLLIDKWIVKYLTSATLAEQERTFETLIKITLRIRGLKSTLGSPNLIIIVQKLFSIILPYCKQAFAKIDSLWLPELIANLCLLSADYKHLNSKEIPEFEILFRTFLDSKSINLSNTIKFLNLVLEDQEKAKKLDNLMTIQLWIKCSILMNGGNSNLKKLTKNVSALDEISLLSDLARNQPEEFYNSKEPLCTVLMDFGKKYSSGNNETKMQLTEKVHGYFSNFEKWALPILQLQQQQQQSCKKSQIALTTDESVMRIYTFVSIAILHCSEIIYNRSKSNCFFNVAISHFILPPSLMMNQNQPRSIIVSMHKVWPLLIEGISKLDYKNDHHIGKVLNDLIVKWAPLLKISPNSKFVSKPFLNVTNISNSAIVELVYGELAKSYIALQNRKPSQSACMILTIVEEVMHVIEADEKKLLLIWRGLMIHVMIHAAMITDDNTPSLITCYNLLERFLHNKIFETSEQLQSLVTSSLKNMTQSHLSYYSAFYFRYVYLLKLHMKLNFFFF